MFRFRALGLSYHFLKGSLKIFIFTIVFHERLKAIFLSVSIVQTYIIHFCVPPLRFTFASHFCVPPLRPTFASHLCVPPLRPTLASHFSVPPLRPGSRCFPVCRKFPVFISVHEIDRLRMNGALQIPCPLSQMVSFWLHHYVIPSSLPA